MLEYWQDVWSDLTQRLRDDDSGQGLIEYALIGALIAVGLILALETLRNAIGGVFDAIIGELNNAPSGQYTPTA